MEKLTVWAISIAIFLTYVVILSSAGYSGMIVTFLVVAAVGSGLMIVARYIVTIRKTVTLRGVGSHYAITSASHAIFAAEDHVIGFPSGSFNVTVTESGTGIAATEVVPKGSGSVVLRFIQIPWAIALYVFGFFALFGLWGALIGFVVAAAALGSFLFFFVVPLALAWLVEIAVKPLVASRVDVQAVEIDDAVQLTFIFRGASAFLVKNKMLGAFIPPVLPPRFAGLISAPGLVAPSPQPVAA